MSKHFPIVPFLFLLVACQGSDSAPVAEETAPVPPGIGVESRAVAGADGEVGQGEEASVMARELVVFEDEDGLSGYRDENGEVVIPASFLVATPFTGEIAAVVDDRGWIFIDREGEYLATAFVFDNVADEISEDRARIVEGDRYGFIATDGEIVVAPIWSFVLPFSEGLAAVCEGCVRQQDGEHFRMVGGEWGYVDLGGNIAIAPRFEQADRFRKGRAKVREDGHDFEIGPDGSELP